MKNEQFIHQTLQYWVRTLEIDGESGESIVTVEDIDRLYSDLTVAFDTLGQRRNSWRLLLTFLSKHVENLRHILKKGISVNLFRPS